MHLFAVSVHRATGHLDRLDRCFDRVAGDLGRLVPGTAWQITCDSGVHARGVHTAATPSDRRELWETPEEALFYDGTPMIAVTGGATGLDAVVPGRTDLPDGVDGEFVAVHVDKRRGRVRCSTDVIGNRLCFVVGLDGATVLSNSLHLLTLLRGHHDLDVDGAASLLTLNSVRPPLTLQRGIERLAPATRCTITPDRLTPALETRLTLDSLRRDRDAIRRSGTRAHLAVLEPRLAAVIERAASGASGGCVALSGGMDSRTVLALSLPWRGDLTYATNGEDDEPDAVNAALVAEAVGVPLLRSRFAPFDAAQLRDTWRNGATAFLRRGEGLSNLSQMFANINRLAEHAAGRSDPDTGPPTLVPGNGAGMAKGLELAPRHAVAPAPVQRQAVETVVRRNVRRHPAVSIDSSDEAERSVRGHVAEALDAGFAPADIPVLECLQRMGGWFANNRLALRHVAEAVAPYHLRDFVVHGLALRPVERCTAAAHRRLLEMTQPALLDVPFSKPFPPRSPAVLVARDLFGSLKSSVRRATRRGEPPAPEPRPPETLPAWLAWLSIAAAGVRAEEVDGDSALWEIVDRDEARAVLDRAAAGRSPVDEARLAYHLVHLLVYDSTMRAELDAVDA